ncbi:poly(A) polymerase [Sphingomonas guangdongensis]|uniref:Poly(A) polymerase n=1 Tax=Sphingomonas guangdongensis TaxID=1141890 RepID=A0A285QZ78_9SPHN|nr:CCA tRNA nucleotidyltransferase [Sphingomonas guangdongensis]SOB87245.1 poly(A) polymerase [Sphingomonas guangdongensis]
MTSLPDAPWRARAGLDELCTVLGAAAGEVRFVGGAVRDTLLGLDVADVDLATVHAPEAVLDRLDAARIRAVPTGLAHGTITAVIESGPVEVTTLRRDLATDGRHATVAFTSDWREDAARRDFAINALYADPLTGAVFDYFGGLDDLAERRVRFIGDPLIRIAEDHLRILRFFRFLARFGDAPDADGLAACSRRANDLMALSRERIRDELLKLLVARDAVRVTALMLDHGILLPVLPEVASTDRLTWLAQREAAVGIAPDPLRRLVALLPRDAVAEVGARLKLSNLQRKRLEIAAEDAGDFSPQALGYRLGIEGAIDRLLLSDRPLADIAALAGWVPPRLPVSGGVLVGRGLSRGPLVAATLHGIEDAWIAAGFPDGDALAAIVDQAVDAALRAESS